MGLSRRQLLAALSTLPVIPSLLPSGARAQGMAQPKFYVHFCTSHGAVWNANMYPAAASPTTQMYAGRTVRRQPLALNVANGRAGVSPVLTASSGVLTQSLANKMNVLQGLDWPLYVGHHSGGHLGNMARNDGSGEAMGDGRIIGANPRVTIDQLMAWSPEFYTSLAGVRERVITMGSRISYAWANPQTRSGAIQEVAGTRDSHVWYDRLFPPGTMVGGPAPRPPAVNRVADQYAALQNSTRRMSAEDKQRLEQHIQRLDELKRRLNVTVGAQCTQPVRPSRSNHDQYGRPYVGDYDVNPTKQVASSQMLNDLIVNAFTCGLSRIAVLHADSTFTDFSGDYHQSVAHRAEQAAPAMDNQMPSAPQGILSGGNQVFFESVVLDLAAKLDATPDGQGGTLLDHALVVWTQESGNVTHNTFSVPVITFGGASGFFNTGNYVDYRNTALVYDRNRAEVENPGLFMHQWFGMALRAMGVPSAQWAEGDHGGYGYRYANVNWGNFTTAQAYPDTLWNVAGENLPFLAR
ncbi:MAG: DUF1552 domain-containing protein [Archangium sp.]|nr:DUF1552 domain-containing protein [Archangium sp.]